MGRNKGGLPPFPYSAPQPATFNHLSIFYPSSLVRNSKKKEFQIAHHPVKYELRFVTVVQKSLLCQRIKAQYDSLTCSDEAMDCIVTRNEISVPHRLDLDAP